MCSRRAKGEGTIYFDKKLKRYVGQFPYIDSDTGQKKRKKFTGVTLKAVNEFGKRFMADVAFCDSPQHVGSDMSLGGYMEQWLETTIRGTVRIKTYERYECAYRCHIKPYLSDNKLNSLTRIILQKFLFMLKERGGANNSGLAPRTVNAVRRLLKMALKYAVADGLLERNPAELTKPIRIDPEPINIFSTEDYKLLLQAAKEYDKRAYLVVRIAFATGLRIGEIFGLEYSAIDFERNTLSVKQTVITSRHGKRVQTTAKNSSSLRTILVEKKLIEELKETYEIHKLKKAVLKEQYKAKKDFIIENEDGSFCDPAYFSHKIFKRKLLPNAGLPNKFRFHDCRHTHATWLLENGVDIKTISERLGHRSIRITMDTYAHVMPKLQQDAVHVLQKVLHDNV